MKVFYHNADLDGICSAAIIYQNNQGKPCDFYGINYGDIFPWDDIKPLPSGQKELVYMVDFSLPINGMIKLANVCDLIWVDHHDTAIKAAKENTIPLTSLAMVLNNDKAGCELTWEYIHGGAEMPMAIYYLGRWDIWKWKDIPNCKSFQMGMRELGLKYNSPIWELLFNDGKGRTSAFSDIVKSGETIERYTNTQNANRCKYGAFPTTFHNLKAICLNGGGGSQLFDSIYNETDYDIMIAFQMNKDKKWTVSLYSTKLEIHCGEIAKLYGGGGHKGAAGFISNNLLFLEG